MTDFVDHDRSRRPNRGTAAGVRHGAVGAADRGVAMMVVLAAVVLVGAACAMLAGAAARRGGSALAQRADAEAADLIAAAGAAIEHWLDRSSARVVLPVDAATPEAAVLHDRWSAAGRPVTVRITAFDLCGMSPPDRPRWLAAVGLPRRAIEQVSAATRDAPDGLGLDMIPSGDGYDLFPAPSGGPATDLDARSVSPARPVAPRSGRPGAARSGRPPAVGAVLATHGDSAPGRAVINISTAPASLIAAACAEIGISPDAMLTARAQGLSRRPPPGGTPLHDGPPPDSPPAADGAAGIAAEAGPAAVRFVSVSTAWAFRVDVSVGRVSRSVWMVYRRASGGWRREQRLVIFD